MTGKERRTTPIRVCEPGVVSLSDEDRQQAVTAISSMIEAWWTRQNRDGEPAAVNSDEGTHPPTAASSGKVWKRHQYQ